MKKKLKKLKLAKETLRNLETAELSQAAGASVQLSSCGRLYDCPVICEGDDTGSGNPACP
jgi:hypothetical protein